MVALQLINDEMNHSTLNLITFGTSWPQELPVNHMKFIKINVEIPVCQIPWNASRDHIIALSSVNIEMSQYVKFEHRVHMEI